MSWSVAGTGLSPGNRLVLEAAMLVTSASGSNTGRVGRVSFAA